MLDANGHVAYDATQGLRTSQGVSPSVRASQLLSSIIGFGLLYTLLLGVWLWLLNEKIQHGPEGFALGVPGGERFLDVAAERPNHADALTEVKAPQGGHHV